MVYGVNWPKGNEPSVCFMERDSIVSNVHSLFALNHLRANERNFSLASVPMLQGEETAHIWDSRGGDDVISLSSP